MIFYNFTMLLIFIMLLLLLLSRFTRMFVIFIALHAAKPVALLQLFGHSAVRVYSASSSNWVMVHAAFREDVGIFTIQKIRMLKHCLLVIA
jgi:hypothetical protein